MDFNNQAARQQSSREHDTATERSTGNRLGGIANGARLEGLAGGSPVRTSFHERVVVAIPAAAHRTRDAVLLEPSAIILARARAAPVGMVQQAGVGTAALQRHVESTQRQMRSFTALDHRSTGATRLLHMRELRNQRRGFQARVAVVAELLIA